MSAHDALELLASCLGRDRALRQIKEWAYLGLIPARAEMLWEQRYRQAEVFRGAAAIPAHFWKSRGLKRMREDWDQGTFDSWATHDHGAGTGIRNPEDVYYRAHNVEFECSDLLNLLPSHLRPTIRKVGRPERYDWAAASEDVFAQFHKFDAATLRKSEVEKALRQVLASQDHYPAKDTIQRHAAPIYHRLKKAEN